MKQLHSEVCAFKERHPAASKTDIVRHFVAAECIRSGIYNVLVLLRCWSVLVECNHLNFTSLYHVLNSTTYELVPLQIRVFRLLRADFFSASNRMILLLAHSVTSTEEVCT